MSIKQVDKMTGYKATNKDLTCQGFQHSGELELCKQGFHFCRYPSGVWAYYSDTSTRVFEIEAECVLQEEGVAGADEKLVCRRIRLVKEITPGQLEGAKTETTSSDNNTGHRNAGDRNTGDRNTGDWNTGDRNTGDSNTGHSNTGYWNTGHRNTGDWNTGDRNTGHSNTGHSNTGHSNTGYWNTGDWNTGDRNTGYFNDGEPDVVVFNAQTQMKSADFLGKYPEAYELGRALFEDAEIDFEKYRNIPGITPEKLKALHAKHLEGRKTK